MTRLPEIGEFVRHQGTLVAIEEIPPKPVAPKKDFIFEEVEARCQLRLHDEVVKDIQTLNDFYGYENGIKTAIAEMKEYAKSRQIDDDSDIEVVVLRVATQYRRSQKNVRGFYDTDFFDFIPLDVGSRYNLPAPVHEIVWSSKSAP